MTRRPAFGQSLVLAAWFVVLWLMLWADLSIGNLFSGILVATAVTLLARRFSSPNRAGGLRISPLGVVVFVAHVLWSLVKSNLFLAWEIVTPTNTIATGIVEVPLRSRSPAIAMAVSNVVALTPGTVTVGVADDSSSLTIGVLHLHSPDHVQRGVQRTEDLAIRAIGTKAARDALAGEVR